MVSELAPINYFNGIWRLSALNVVLNDISLHTNQMLPQPVDLIKVIISAILLLSESATKNRSKVVYRFLVARGRIDRGRYSQAFRDKLIAVL